MVKEYVYSRQRDEYVAECVRIVTENTAAIGRGKYLQARLSDITQTKKEEEESRTAEEIIENISSKLAKLAASGG